MFPFIILQLLFTPYVTVTVNPKTGCITFQFLKNTPHHTFWILKILMVPDIFNLPNTRGEKWLRQSCWITYVITTKYRTGFLSTAWRWNPCYLAGFYLVTKINRHGTMNFHILTKAVLHEPETDTSCLTVTCKGEGKAFPSQAWNGLEGSRKLRYPDFMTMAQDVDKRTDEVLVCCISCNPQR